jgi:hypothetical protein
MPIVSKIKKNQGFLPKKLKCNIPIFLNNIYTRINVINIHVCQYLKNNKGLFYGCYKGSKHTNKMEISQAILLLALMILTE